MVVLVLLEAFHQTCTMLVPLHIDDTVEVVEGMFEVAVVTNG